MAKKKLLEDIKAQPARFYRIPGDVLRDRRFDNSERLEILTAWHGADEMMRSQIDGMILELENRGLATRGQAAE